MRVCGGSGKEEQRCPEGVWFIQSVTSLPLAFWMWSSKWGNLFNGEVKKRWCILMDGEVAVSLIRCMCFMELGTLRSLV